ncbi:MAG: hypothetical protein A3E01_07165 [Gammaproteobacteria bacterium RIFCSPHIGHO2_12_FULL_63_22]|nr:MAG: hypothetical protein A3E01_07165 [Gammaproteobacteria bacterium RIFCSPHIGHO2_12_FULL_63_22]
MTNEVLVGVGPDESAAMPTHELMSWLDERERDRFVKFQETFESAGWRLVTEFASAKIVQHGVDGANASSWEKVLENRGSRLAWEQVSKLAEEFMTAFEQMAETSRAEANAEQDGLE